MIAQSDSEITIMLVMNRGDTNYVETPTIKEKVTEENQELIENLKELEPDDLFLDKVN